MNKIGYHGTIKIYRDNILHNGFDVNKCTQRNDHWLGRGIYFFVDKEYAFWWVSDRKEGIVLSCKIVCDDDKVLDLDKVDSYKKFTRKCKEYEKKYKGTYQNKNQYRCSMIELYKKDVGIYVAIRSFKVSEKYSRIYNKFNINKDIVCQIGLPLLQKQICVYDANVISDIKEESNVN